jgi:transcriptional regulator with XRE-family HTH domain
MNIMNTKISSVQERLKQIMAEEGLRQADIVDLCKPFSVRYGIPVTKSDISSYCIGRSEPQQNKMYVLANALHVSEAWLMGYDVKRNQDRSTISEAKEDINLLSKFGALSERDKLVVKQLIDIMLKTGGA